MKKIIVIGCPGSGKSTFSRKLGEKLNIPVYHLDMLFWNRDKTTVDDETFMKRLNEVLSKDQWIIDGHYMKTLEHRIKSCDTIFYLDMPVDLCLENVTNRIGRVRPDMPWVEKKDQEYYDFIEYIKNFKETKTPYTLELLNKYQDKNMIRFTSFDEINTYLK